MKDKVWKLIRQSIGCSSKISLLGPLNKAQEAEVAAAATSLIRDDRPPFPLAEKIDTDIASETYKSKVTMKSKSIVASQKVVLADLASLNKSYRSAAFQLTRVVMIYHPAVNAYNPPYFYSSTVTPGVVNFLPSGNPVE